MTNWGAHGVDQIQWALGMDGTGPEEIWPITAGLERPGRHALSRRRRSPLRVGEGADAAGRIFIGEKGKLEINRNKVTSNPPEIAADLLKQLDVTEEERKWDDKLALWQARWHLQDWLNSIRSRQLPVADVEIGHRSISVCHLANITRQLGRRLKWDAAAEHFVGDSEADERLTRPRRARLRTAADQLIGSNRRGGGGQLGGFLACPERVSEAAARREDAAIA